MPRGPRLSLDARAQLLGSPNPKPLSDDDLEYLTHDLSTSELQQLVRLLGLESQAHRLDALLPRIMAAAQVIVQRTPVAEDDNIDSLIRNFDLSSLNAGPSSPTTPPELPSSPARRPTTRSVPSTPARAQGGYRFASPGLTGETANWLTAGVATQGVPGASVVALSKSSINVPQTPRAGAYVVFIGHNVDVYENWIDVSRQIVGAAHAYQCGFPSVAAGQKALAYARSKGWTADSPVRNIPYPLPSSYEPNPLNSPTPGGPSKWFAVRSGIHPGIYSSGLECHLNVAGIRNSVYKGYGTRAEAENDFTS